MMSTVLWRQYGRSQPIVRMVSVSFSADERRRAWKETAGTVHYHLIVASEAGSEASHIHAKHFWPYSDLLQVHQVADTSRESPRFSSLPLCQHKNILCSNSKADLLRLYHIGGIRYHQYLAA